MIAWAVTAAASAGPGPAPTPTRAAVAAASYVPMPPGAIATVCAAIVTAVTRAASAGDTSMPAQPAHDQIRTLSSSHAAVAPGTARASHPRVAPPDRRTTRASHQAAATSSSAATTASGIAASPTRRCARPGPRIAAMAMTARTSPARRNTVDAVAGATGTFARRTTETTRSGSPSRRGSRWLPASDTWIAASDCPNDSPGSVRHHSPARMPNARAYAARASARPSGSSSAAATVSPIADRSTAQTRYATLAARATAPTAVIADLGRAEMRSKVGLIFNVG